MHVKQGLAILLVVPIVVLAGCIDSVPSGTDAGEAQSHLQPTDVSAESTELRPVNERPVEDSFSAQKEESIPIKWDGRLASGAWACERGVIRNCTGHELSEGESMLHPVFGGTPRAAKIVASWSATSPLTSRLRLGVMGMCVENCTDMGYVRVVEGVSPLTIEAKEIRVQQGEIFCLFVTIPQFEAGDASALASLDQEFTLKGTVSVLMTPANTR